MMKKLILSLACLCLLAGAAPAGVVLSTSNPPGTPLIMNAGSTSGSMLVNVVSDNPPNDVMAAWNVTLAIVPEAGATGTLSFQDPATGTPSPPPNYIFDGNGLGISATNSVSQLSANDFFNPQPRLRGRGTRVAGGQLVGDRLPGLVGRIGAVWHLRARGFGADAMDRQQFDYAILHERTRWNGDGWHRGGPNWDDSDSRALGAGPGRNGDGVRAGCGHAPAPRGSPFARLHLHMRRNRHLRFTRSHTAQKTNSAKFA